MTKKLLLLPIAILAMLMCPTKAWAQKNTVTGKVTEMRSGETLVGATAVLLNPKDSAQVSGAVTGETGVFTISPKNGGKYILRISFIGYKPYFKNIELKGKTATNLGTIVMHEDATLMQQANVIARLAQVEMKADTFVYNADAYRMPEGAVLEELVKKLPGAEVEEDGTIKINGKTVKKIMVDGKDFFSNDTQMSM